METTKMENSEKMGKRYKQVVTKAEPPMANKT